MFEVLHPGSLMLVEDAGRPGWASVAVPPSGAADTGSFRLANRLVGNHDQAAVLEIIGGFRMRITAACYLAVTGAQTDLSLEGAPQPTNGLLACRPGQILEANFAKTGLRNYLAIRGGVAAKPVLGSRSHDLLSGLGPPPLAPGDSVEADALSSTFPEIELAPVRPTPAGPFEVLPGPQTGWLTGPLAGRVFTVLPDSNRVAVRLAGDPVELSGDTEVPPQGLVKGAIQVTRGNQLVIFGPDHPITGGYPVVAVIAEHHLDRVAQLRPGDSIVLAPSRD